MLNGFDVPSLAAFHAMFLGREVAVSVVPEWLPDGRVVFVARLEVDHAMALEAIRRAALLGAVPLVRQAVGGDLPPGIARRHLHQLK